MAEVKITITAEDGTKTVFSAVQEGAKSAFDKVASAGESSTSRIRSAWDSMKSHWVEITVGLAAAWQTASKAWDLAEMSAGFEEQKASLNSLAAQYNTTADAIIKSIQEASNGLVSMADAADIAGRSLLKNLSPDQVINLASAAETLSNVTGKKVVDSFRSMTEAIATGRARGLEAEVGIIDLEAKYGDLAKTMTDAEKAQAMYAIVMERVKAVQESLGPSTDSLADKMERLTVSIADLKLQAGAFVIKAGLLLYGLFQETAAVALALSSAVFRVVSGVAALTDAIGITTGAYDEWKNSAEAAAAASKDLGIKGRENMSALFASAESVVGAQGRVKNATMASTAAIKDNTKAIAEQAAMVAKIKEQQQGYANLVTGLNETIWNATPIEKYYNKQDQLDAQFKMAMEMTGQAKIDALTKYQQASASAAEAVSQDGKEFLSVQEASVYALNRVSKAQEEIEKAQNGLMEKLGGMKMDVEVDPAIAEVARLQSAIDAIREVTYKTIVVQTVSAGGSSSTGGSNVSGGTNIEGGFASGTSYVPRTGLYQLHQGEKVLNRSEVSNKRSTVVHINMPPITVQSSGNENPEAMAERLVRPLRRKLQELAFVS